MNANHPITFPSPLWEKTGLLNQGLNKLQRKYLSKQPMVWKDKTGVCIVVAANCRVVFFGGF